MTETSLNSLSLDTTEQLTRRGLKVMWSGIRRERWMFFLAVAASVFFGFFTVADAWVLGWATDNAIVPAFEANDSSSAAIRLAALLFVGVALMRTVSVIGRRLFGGVVFHRLVRGDRLEVTGAYVRLPLSWHRRHSTGSLLSNANADVEARWGVFMPLPMAIGTIAMLVAAIVTMLAADVVLTIVGLISFPLLFLANGIYQRWQAPRIALAQRLRSELSTVAHESFDGALVVKSLGRESSETARFQAVSEELREANVSVGRVRAVFDPLVEALPNLSVLAVILLGTARVVAGQAAPGDVVQIAFMFTVVAMPVRSFGWVLGELPRAVVGEGRVTAVLNDRSHMPWGTDTLPGSGPTRLHVHNASFFHPDDESSRALSDITFEVAPGTVTAIVGATGSGKSTLISMLARLTDPNHGSVSYEGVDARHLSQQAFTADIALVPQTTFIFDDTVRSNIALDLDLSDDTVWDVLALVQAKKFVTELPHGLDTILGERGTSLSGGQRQRIALARALIREPRVLLMDDATSALDPHVEQAILQSLGAQRDAPTTVVVAYRKATIALADRVILMGAGQIEDQGTDAELRARSPRYRDLVDAYDIARGEVDHE